MNFVYLFGIMKEMIAAAVEHQKAEEAAQQELGAKSPVGIQGMKDYDIVKDQT